MVVDGQDRPLATRVRPLKMKGRPCRQPGSQLDCSVLFCSVRIPFCSVHSVLKTARRGDGDGGSRRCARFDRCCEVSSSCVL